MIFIPQLLAQATDANQIVVKYLPDRNDPSVVHPGMLISAYEGTGGQYGNIYTCKGETIDMPDGSVALLGRGESHVPHHSVDPSETSATDCFYLAHEVVPGAGSY